MGLRTHPPPPYRTIVAIPPSSRLLSLPAELRNQIHNLAFTSNHDHSTPIDIHYSTPPSKSLLLNCRQIATDAHQLCREAYRTYRTSYIFTFDDDTRSSGTTILASPLDMVRITNFNMTSMNDNIGGTTLITIWHLVSSAYGANIWKLRTIQEPRDETVYVVFARPDSGGPRAAICGYDFDSKEEAKEW